MSNREFTATRTMLANAMATAGAELLSYMGVSSALAAIPNTEPPQYVVAGTLAMIAKVLPAAPVPPLTAPAPLTDANLIADLTEFTERSIREHADFRDDIERLSTADRRTRKALRKEIYDTIDTRVRNAVKASLAAKAAPAAPVQTAVQVPRSTLLMIYEAMNHMGDILNNMDACEEEDEDATTPAFDAIRELLDDSYVAAPVQAEQAQAEPVAWLEAEPSARGQDPRHVAWSMLYRSRIHTMCAPMTSNPVWPLYAAPVAALPAQAEQAAEVRAAEWISVDERLPEVGQLVMVYSPPTKYDHPGEVNITFDCIDPNDDDHASWLNHNEHYEHFCCVAKPEGSVGPSAEAPYTHWMPLPAAPSTATSNDTGALGGKGAE